MIEFFVYAAIIFIVVYIARDDLRAFKRRKDIERLTRKTKYDMNALVKKKDRLR